ncbi:Mn2+ and Fe2+ transporters of the NRAMP family [Quadrisphaera granulorum]|uniref:Mn2+/Fe2+ NRAMP family transporter n=1 Tax=Quadrisphaera granulorum TaxID=317664 RepID=A0A315ZXF9_9ACTN|nr:Nramp family divalent metal transporter [Quadrisphaera granulorum]PWJ49580.1 Mn2+/Fe2+ NRAMP family transporter [Quadrisphaera granulorum]SZE98159.1 Mn2+ and Fe2+ transporters of the NRAMP family [Quadrisphaera granulorum]
MSTTTTDNARAAQPPTGRERLKHLGPGLLAAATGVGAGDLVATLVAGAQYGTALLWAALVGTALKLALGEGVGRWHLASGTTLLDGWRRLGRWATTFFGVYIIIWGFVYGATGMSAVGLPLNALFGGLSVGGWAAIAGLVGLVLVWFQRYEIFEKFMTVLVMLKFVAVVSTALLVGPNIADLTRGLVPTLPDGSAVYVLGLIGGVGGTITMAAYGYWMFAKGWRGAPWLGMMRLDNAVGYVMTGIFVISMLIVGSTMLRGMDLTADDAGLLVLGDALGQEFGQWARVLFLAGFLAVTSSSLLGVWNGVSLMFADWTRTIRLPHGRAAEEQLARAAAVGTATDPTADPTARVGADEAFSGTVAERSWAFRGYLLWLTLPPMLLLTLGKPFLLTLVYGVLGSVFMPFLAITLMLLLNSRRVAAEGRSRWLSNGLLGLASALFVTLFVVDIQSRFF